jgi:hypothetical protein
VDDVEKIVAEDTTFDGTGEMVNRSIDEAGNKGE